MLNKKNIVMMVVVILVVVVVGLWVKNRVNEGKGYSVVYLSTGEVYVGQLTTHPDFQLKEAYVLQITKDTTDATKSNFQLNPISEAIWAPQVMHLNKQNIIFYGPLTTNSKIAETLATQKSKVLE